MQNLREPFRIPTEQDAKRILQHTLHKEARQISRFPTGLANYVYDIETQEGEHLVVRLARSDLGRVFEGALHWHSQLKAIGVPLPSIYYSSSNPAENGFPVMIMERVPGEDLYFVYPTLTSQQKHTLAQRIVAIQKSVATLPFGSGYGYASSQSDPSLLPHWIDVLDENIERSRMRITQVGAVDSAIVDQIKNLIHQYEAHFSTVRPTCFLDDTTTKNVVIHHGALSGIVDVDTVAYGDPLLTLGLTQTALLSSDYDTEYTGYWTQLLDLNAEQQKALKLYTAMFCVDFLSEKGHAFNKDEAALVEQEEIKHLTGIFNRLLDGL